ncbi:hypothetical protein QR680_014448 [Steinernema hermaphroditum]|uniref:Uncharacterized protein n=1 Tax=Steinernema hermaphroditum TaxID=289476 RepID=A0AA39I8W9_9BILA|nr:hypothetical protein QR680_014448 [Steinernema hermaphroditum]
MDRHACVIGEERGIILIVDSSESRMEDEPPRHPSPEIRNNFGLVELTKEAEVCNCGLICHDEVSKASLMGQRFQFKMTE